MKTYEVREEVSNFLWDTSYSLNQAKKAKQKWDGATYYKLNIYEVVRKKVKCVK